MKQKAVFKVSLNDLKKRSQALKIVVGFPGVTKAEVQGDDKGKLAIEGEDLDITGLTKKLRKKLGSGVDLVTFQAAGKDKEKEEAKKMAELYYSGYLPVHPQPGYWTPAHPYYAQAPMYADPYYDDGQRCSIM